MFLAKQDLVVAGLRRPCGPLNSRIRPAPGPPLSEEGVQVSKNTVIAKVYGPVPALLLAERTALNLLQRLCGIATATARAAASLEGRPRVLDTRKTTPGFGTSKKYAVPHGGRPTTTAWALAMAHPPRDNHDAAAGSVAAAVVAARNHAGPLLEGRSGGGGPEDDLSRSSRRRRQ